MAMALYYHSGNQLKSGEGFDGLVCSGPSIVCLTNQRSDVSKHLYTSITALLSCGIKMMSISPTTPSMFVNDRSHQKTV